MEGEKSKMAAFCFRCLYPVEDGKIDTKDVYLSLLFFSLSIYLTNQNYHDF